MVIVARTLINIEAKASVFLMCDEWELIDKIMFMIVMTIANNDGNIIK